MRARCPWCGESLHESEHPKGVMYSCWNCTYGFLKAEGYRAHIEEPVFEDD